MKELVVLDEDGANITVFVVFPGGEMPDPKENEGAWAHQVKLESDIYEVPYVRRYCATDKEEHMRTYPVTWREFGRYQLPDDIPTDSDEWTDDEYRVVVAAAKENPLEFFDYDRVQEIGGGATT